MAVNNFLPFATGSGANVETQSTYAADPNLPIGNQPGIASSAFNNKALRQANVITSQLAQFIANQSGTDMLDDTNLTRVLSQMFSVLDRKLPVVTRYTTGSGNHNLTYKFQIVSGNATVGATYTNNGVTYTVSATIAAGLELVATGSGAPSVSGTLTKASGTGDATITFNAVRAPIYLRAKLVGAGGKGGGGGAGSTGGSTGGNTSFGSSLLVANGGAGGSAGGSLSAASGGTVSVSSPAITVAAVVGSQGPSGIGVGGTAIQPSAGVGGTSPFGGAGGSGYNVAGGAAAANSGSGGGGGSVSSASTNGSGGGGGSGGYIEALINAPTGSYPYSIGAGGTTAGAAGTSGFAGGNGGDGIVIVEEHYQ